VLGNKPRGFRMPGGHTLLNYILSPLLKRVLLFLFLVETGSRFSCTNWQSSCLSLPSASITGVSIQSQARFCPSYPLPLIHPRLQWAHTDLPLKHQDPDPSSPGMVVTVLTGPCPSSLSLSHPPPEEMSPKCHIKVLWQRHLGELESCQPASPLHAQL